MSFPFGQPVTEPVVLTNGTHGLLVILPVPATCQRCQRAVRLFINRNGSTACVSCDGHVQTSADQPR